MPNPPPRDTALRGLIRPRLHQLATEGDARFVCSIVAPAGYGKTTLLHELARQHVGPVAQINATAEAMYGHSLQDLVERELAAATEAFANDSSRSVPGPDSSRSVPGPDSSRSVSGPDSRTDDAGAHSRLVTIDDAHLFSGTPAASQLASIASLAGPDTQIIFAGRADPAIDLASLRMNNAICEIGADDLRFRSWEVEELFQRVFGVRLPPRELASLAATTQGWAAGLQLYRHATQRSSDTVRVQQLELLRQSRLEAVRSYLSANVLSGLDDDLRSFALGSSVLGRMEPSVCNRLLNRIDSQRCLDRLVSAQLFTTRSDDGSFRYHEIFRSYLEAELVVERDTQQIQELYTRAAKLLEASHAIPDAIRAHTMAGNDAEVERLTADLPTSSSQPQSGSPAWLLSDDHARLARARSLVRSGRGQEGLRELTALAAAPVSDEVRPLALWERDRIRRWLEPALRPVDPTDWTSVVREALKQCAKPTTTSGLELANAPEAIALTDQTLVPFTQAIVSLLQGRPKDSARQFADLDLAQLDGPLAIIGSALGAIAWWLVDGQDPSFTLSDLRDSTDRENSGWITLLLRATLLGFPVPHDPPVIELLDQLDNHAQVCGDLWAPAIGRLFMLLGSANGTLRAIDDPGVHSIEEQATQSLRALGADTLAVWSVGARALIQRRRRSVPMNPVPADAKLREVLVLQADLRWAASNPGALAASLKDSANNWSEQLADEGPVLRFGLFSRFLEFGSVTLASKTVTLATPAESGFSSDGRAEASSYVDVVVADRSLAKLDFPAEEHGIVPSDGSAPQGAASAVGKANGSELLNAGGRILTVTLFGPFSLRINGNVAPLTNLRPQAKSILRFLALRAAPVHREVIVDTMWPNADPEAARKRLYVAISAIRQELGIAASALERTGDTYALGGNGWTLRSDVGAFDSATEKHQLMLRRAKSTSGTSSPGATKTTCPEALAAADEIVTLYLGELLPEEGPQDWAVHEREFRMRTYLRSIAVLVDSYQALGDWDSVARYAQLGLRSDRYQDDLWNPLLNALEQSGRSSELRSAKAQYSAFLAELGVA
jgi:DNA-binding SARP family transcriptional activator